MSQTTVAYPWKTKQSKFGNKKTEYKGDMYDSKAEARYASELDTLKNARFEAERVVTYERQVRYPFEVNGVKIATYVLDFKVTYADGRVEHVDVKGMRTDVYKMKKKLMLACYGIEIIEKSYGKDNLRSR